MVARRRSARVVMVLLALALTGCSSGGPGSADGAATGAPTSGGAVSSGAVPSGAVPSEAVTSGAAAAPAQPSVPRPEPTTTDCGEGLRAELLGMMERDQAGRTGGEDSEGDRARTRRLQQVVSECGWPTTDQVGADGAEAAWVVAQHSDLDPDFQAEALVLLQAAADAGQASRGDAAYLEDRVAAGRGEPQRFGTQVACVDGVAGPANGLVDEAEVDELRAAAGLEPLEDYYASLGDDFCG